MRLKLFVRPRTVFQSAWPGLVRSPYAFLFFFGCF